MSAADTKAAGPPVPVPPDPQATGKSSSHDDAPRVQKRKRKKGELLPYLLILPAIVAIAAVYLYPLGKTVIMSFQDMGRRELWSGEL